jgi:hypothetical protein
MGVSALFPVRVAKPWPPERGRQSRLQMHEEEKPMKKHSMKGGENL